MPKISLIICTHGDRAPLARLLEKTRACCDELLVIHDGPDFEDVRGLVEQYGGRFIERPRAFSQEPHVPFAIGEASHDWILRFDSDEYPSEELRQWLIKFRGESDAPENISGYGWICPAWNGRRAITKNWPNKWIRLFNRNQVRIVGVCENPVLLDAPFLKVPVRIRHEPRGPSHGLRNLFGKERTRRNIGNLVHALLGSPLEQPRWRYENEQWPHVWQQAKDHPVSTGLWRLLVWPPRQALAMLLAGDVPRPSVFAHGGIYHAMICFELWRLRDKPRPHERAS